MSTYGHEAGAPPIRSLDSHLINDPKLTYIRDITGQWGART